MSLEDENTENCRKLDFHSTDAATFAYAPVLLLLSLCIVSTYKASLSTHRFLATSGQKWHAASICANSITEARNIQQDKPSPNLVWTQSMLNGQCVYSLSKV